MLDHLTAKCHLPLNFSLKDVQVTSLINDFILVNLLNMDMNIKPFIFFLISLSFWVELSLDNIYLICI